MLTLSSARRLSEAHLDKYVQLDVMLICMLIVDLHEHLYKSKSLSEEVGLLCCFEVVTTNDFLRVNG